MRVVILGAKGMLGQSLVREFAGRGIATFQASRLGPIFFDGSKSSVEALTQELDLSLGDFVINTVGQVKSQIREDSPHSIQEAILANSVLPYLLAAKAELMGFRMVSPATDCVFSGSSGQYSEASVHDAIDIYGKSKSLGEVKSPQALNIRSSFVGPEKTTRKMLLEWLRNQATDASLNGFTDHYWNGVTVDCVARVFAGLVESQSNLHGTYHLVPADVVTKYELLQLLKKRLGRDDLKVTPSESGSPTNRSLVTRFDETNLAMWNLAGYGSPQSISTLVAEQWTEIED